MRIGRRCLNLPLCNAIGSASAAALWTPLRARAKSIQGCPRHAFAQTTRRIFGSTPALFERMRLASLLNHLSAHLVDVSLAARARLCAPLRAWSWTYQHARRVHPLTAISGRVVLLPLTYLAYCIVTLPGEAVIEPTASALVVQADGGQVFATRGVFKGEKLSAHVPLCARRIDAAA